MSKQSIILSSAGLKNVIIDKEEEFVFKIGKKELKMSKIFAEFISPRVSHIHQCDPTINFINLSEFFNNTKNTSKFNKILEELGSETFFTQILNLSQGNNIEIENNQIIKLMLYFSILVNNEELFNKINEIQMTNNKNENNIKELLEEIEILYELNPTFNGLRCSKLINEISSKINENNKNILKEVPKQILYLILNNEHFKFEDINSIFDLINEIFSKEINEDEIEEEYDITSFYELIDINKLSKDKFASFISTLDYRKLTSNLWSKICQILLNHTEKHVLKIEFIQKVQKL